MKNVINIIINGMYQLFLVLIPVVTMPYVARVLGASNLGLYAYSFSIVNFLGVIINFGMNQLGVREIAKSDNKLLLFDKLWKLQSRIGFIIIFLYFLIVALFVDNNKLLFLAHFFYLVSFLFDISWFFIGIGSIKKVVFRNTLVKIIGVVLIFTLIKDSNDLNLYVLINGLTFLLSNLFFWIEIKKERKKNTSKGSLVVNEKLLFKNAFMLLTPQIAVQIYTSLDKVIVRNLTDNIQVSFYDQSQKISRIILALITSVNIILMPKLAEKEDSLSTYNIMKKSLFYTMFISFLCTILLLVNAYEFVPWFFGSEFKKMSTNMVLSSFIIPLISIGGVFSTQYALAKGFYQRYAFPYYVGSIINVMLLISLAPRYGAIGATIALVMTELLVFIVRIYVVKDEISIPLLFNYTQWFQLLSVALICYLIGYFLPINTDSVFFNMFTKSAVVTICYFISLLFLKTEIYIDLQKIIMLIKERKK